MMQETTNKGEIIIYQAPDGTADLNVRLENETVWLTQAQMVVLFNRDQSVISRHIKNIFKEGELSRNSVYAYFAYTASDGKTYFVDHFNLDVIISVGYRIKSQCGTQFRIWANKILKNYIIKGYVINDKIKIKQYEELKQTVKLLSNVIFSTLLIPYFKNKTTLVATMNLYYPQTLLPNFKIKE